MEIIDVAALRISPGDSERAALSSMAIHPLPE
jgi:hypothetical protein